MVAMIIIIIVIYNTDNIQMLRIRDVYYSTVA